MKLRSSVLIWRTLLLLGLSPAAGQEATVISGHGRGEVRFADLQESSAQVTLAPGAITQDFSLEAPLFETITVGSRAAGAAAEKAVPVDGFTYPSHSPFGMNGRFVYTRVSFTF